MRPEVVEIVQAMRATHLEAPQESGLWSIGRAPVPEELAEILWGDLSDQFSVDVTMLDRWTMATIHQGRGEVVMSDDPPELVKHLSAVLQARGRVLVTGLGLGCVVRGMLARPEVEHIDVVELERSVLEMVGPSFDGEPRVTLHHGDALQLEWPPGTRWDLAWHDAWVEKPGNLHVLHGEILSRYQFMAKKQGAWAFPRAAKRLVRNAV